MHVSVRRHGYISISMSRCMTANAMPRVCMVWLDILHVSSLLIVVIES